jgi:hypothetical protein
MTAKTIRLFDFDKDDIAYLHRQAAAIWQELGGDALQAIAEEKGKDPESITISRAEAMEIALDAGRVDQRIIDDKKLDPVKKEQYLKFLDHPSMSWKNKLRFFRPAFPYDRYGM